MQNIRIPPSSNKDSLITSVMMLAAGCFPGASMPETKVSSSADREPSSTPLSFTARDAHSQQVSTIIAQTDQDISQHFVNWFYPILNSLNGPTFNTAAQTKWSANHFWPDCKFRSKISLGVEHGQQQFQLEEVESSQLVYEKLASFVCRHKIIFNVNDTPSGHRGRISPHGLARVAACGTLHKITPDNQLQGGFGTFEQIFGLMRDPAEDNRWKIKFSDLSIDGVSGEIAGLSLSESSMLQLLAE